MKSRKAHIAACCVVGLYAILLGLAYLYGVLNRGDMFGGIYIWLLMYPWFLAIHLLPRAVTSSPFFGYIFFGICVLLNALVLYLIVWRIGCIAAALPDRVSRLRWTARILSMFCLAYSFFLLIAELVRDWQQILTFREGLPLLSLGVLVVGYLLAWKWEPLGGALGVAATIAFGVSIDVGVVMPMIMAIPGFLFLLCRPLSRGGSDAEGSP